VTDEAAQDIDVSKPMAGWYADPRVPFQLRWWDGEGWTTNVYMPDRNPEPALAELVPELAEQPGGKWSWPQ
jgi:hypothetical protein